MSRLLFAGAFLLGALVVAWIGAGFIHSNALALAVTAVIGVVYLIGFAELYQFRRVTDSLGRGLTALPEQPCDSGERLDAWLGELHPSLRHLLRRRVQGHRVALPAPGVTSYLVGLLVMLGLLGTFVGLVDTLRGAVQALEASTDLAAIRAGIAAPMRGLGLAFGTSVAGVASSAMLGLGSALSRRDRLQLVSRLDAGVDAVFGTLSLDHGRLTAFRALERQADSLPAVAARLDALAERLEQRSAALDARLGEGQERFHAAAERSYAELAASVDRSLRDSLVQSGRMAADGVRPVVAEAMAGIGAAAAQTQARLEDLARTQLDVLVSGFEQATHGVLASFEQSSAAWIERQAAADSDRLQHWAAGLEAAGARSREQTREALSALSEEFGRVGAGQREAFASAARASAALAAEISGQWQQAGERADRLTATLADELAALRAQEERSAQAAAERLAALETSAAARLDALGRSLEQPMARLMAVAAEAPRAAAELVAELRQQSTRTIERDNHLLDERRQVMASLSGLAQSLTEATAGQRAAVEHLVASSAELLEAAGARLAGQVGSELSAVVAATEQVGASAAELASLGEAFGLAVNLFAESSASVVDKLDGIEQALERATARSDEQMGYYVAQAREIIDHSLLAQQDVIEQLRRLGSGAGRTEVEVG